MEDLSPNGKYQIFLKETDDDSYFYSYRDSTWYVISQETGDNLFTFSGSRSSTRSGDTTDGTKDVSFDKSGSAFIVKDFNGTEETIPLPLKIDIVNQGESIVLKYENGEEEVRKRCSAMYFTKYGEPVSILPLVNPKN